VAAPRTQGRALVELNCETDFVAKNEDVPGVRARAGRSRRATRPGDVTRLRRSARTARAWSKRQALVQKIGENISIRRFERLQASGRIALYVHGNRKTAVLVDFEGEDEPARTWRCTSRSTSRVPVQGEVAPDVIAREREILAARASEAASRRKSWRRWWRAG
jgi:elongation factor Ts